MKLWFGFAALLTLAACDGDGVVRPPPVSVSFFNAASNVESISFFRERSTVESLPYGDGVRLNFDSGPYEFTVQTRPVGGDAIFSTQSETLAAGFVYTFVALAPGGVPQYTLYARPEIQASTTTTRISIVNAHAGLGPVDVYFQLPGTDLTTVTPDATISFGQDIATFDVTPDLLRIFITTAGDPADLRFESTTQDIGAGGDAFLVVSDPGASGTVELLVSIVNFETVFVGQVGQNAALRVAQGIDDRLARDIYLDDTTAPPLFPAQPFGVVSEQVEIAPGGHEFIVTPVGNPGTEELAQSISMNAGLQFMEVVAGNTTDGIESQIFAEDLRSIDGQATLRVVDAAGLFNTLGVYVFVLEPGTDVSTAAPSVTMNAPGFSPRLPLAPGDYEVSVVDVLTLAPLAGPDLVTMESGGVYGILLTNGDDASTVDLTLYDDFIP